MATAFNLGSNLASNLGSNLGQGGGANNYMQDVIASCCYDTDATISDSYDGSSQSFFNLIPSPADGADQDEYDFWLGINGTPGSDDPQFVGTAGDPAAYFLCDGSQEFRLKAFTGDTVANWIITGTSHPAWCAIALRTPSSFANNDYVWGNSISTSGYGIALGWDSDGSLEMSHRAGSNAITDFSTTLSTNTNYVLVLTWDANAGTVRLFTETLSETPSVSFITNASTQCSTDFTMLARGGGNDATTGTRFYGMSIGNELIDASQAQDIIDEYSSRHSRSYS